MKLARMADAIDVSRLPDGLAAYAGYVDGYWPTFDQLCQRFYPRAHCISITVRGGNARFADVESGDLRPDQGARWLVNRVPTSKGGRWTPLLEERYGITPQWRPGLYFSVSLRPSIVKALADIAPDLQRADYCLWGAHWNGHLTAQVPSGYDAMQEMAEVSPGYDLSILGPRFLTGARPLERSATL